MTTSALTAAKIQSAGGSFVPGGNGVVDRVVMHRMQAPLKAGVARAIGNYFAGGSGGRNVSCHYGVDPAEIIAYLEEEDKGYHAPPNAHSIGVEQAGFCENNDWATVDGQALLDRSAKLVADLCRRHNLPPRWLNAGDLKLGRRGVTAHHQVSIAWGQSSHTDPDPYFPVDAFMAKVQAELGVPTPLPLPPTPPPPPPPQPQLHHLPPLPPGVVLQLGSTGPLVQAYQSRMRDRGWHYQGQLLVADGRFGPKTKQVTIWFQQEKGLDVDGKVGPETWGRADVDG